jgi:Zn-dependent alcohol dehydrogenase
MRDIPRYVRLIESGRFDAKSLVGTVLPLEKTLEAYRGVIDRTTVNAVIRMA